MGLFRASSGALQASGHLLLSLLESLSARLAISLDILSTCSTNIFVPRNLPGYLSAFRMAEADLSFFSQLLRHSHLTVVLSTLNNTRFPAIKIGNVTRGMRSLTASNVGNFELKKCPFLPATKSRNAIRGMRSPSASKMADLDPNPHPFSSLAWYRSSLGQVSLLHPLLRLE